jgi:hypothetical protein
LQQALRILSASTERSQKKTCDPKKTCDHRLDNVANAQFALSNLNWGNTFNVGTSNAIGKHRFDVGCDGAAFGWLQ